MVLLPMRQICTRRAWSAGSNWESKIEVLPPLQQIARGKCQSSMNWRIIDKKSSTDLIFQLAADKFGFKLRQSTYLRGAAQV